MVYVTLDLNPDEVPPGLWCLRWGAGGLEGFTPPTSHLSLTCCLPRGIFEHQALVKLAFLPAYPSEHVVLAWTHIPVLGEASFRAQLIGGAPVLEPVKEERGPKPRITGSSHLGR